MLSQKSNTGIVENQTPDDFATIEDTIDIQFQEAKKENEKAHDKVLDKSTQDVSHQKEGVSSQNQLSQSGDKKNSAEKKDILDRIETNGQKEQIDSNLSGN